jgi:type I restriction enzyme S subunit
VFHKDAVTGASLGNKRVFEVVPGALAMNIVFAWEGAVAVISDRERGMIASHRFPMFVPDGDAAVDVEFLRRFFQTELGIRLLGDASPGGAGRNRTLNQKFVAEIPLPVPPVGEQRKIAAILSVVDETIEATQAVIGQLQVVKRAVMADLLTRGLPGRHTQFKQSAIGEVPEAWDVTSLGGVLEGIDAGWSPRCLPRTAGPAEWGVLKVSAVSWGTFREEENKLLPPELEGRPDIEVKAGDVLISRANTTDLVGRSVYVRTTRPRLLLSDKLLRLRPKAQVMTSGFLNAVLGSRASRAQIEDGASGSSRSMKNISQESLRSVIVPIPALDEQNSIVAVFVRLGERNEAEVELLQALHDVKASLTSALLTGEVRVTAYKDAV